MTVRSHFCLLLSEINDPLFHCHFMTVSLYVCMSLYACVSSGVCGIRLASPGLSWWSVQSVSSAVLPVSGSVGGSVSVGSVDQCPLSLPLQVLQRCNRLQDLRMAAAHCRSVIGPTDTCDN